MLLAYFLTYRAPSQILLMDALLRLLDCVARIDFSVSSFIGGINLLLFLSSIINFLIDSARSGVASEILAILALASLVRSCFMAFETACDSALFRCDSISASACACA